MARIVIQTKKTKVYDAHGRHVGDLIDTDTVAGPDDPRPQVQVAPPSPPQGSNGWQELLEVAQAWARRHAVPQPPVAQGAYWPDVPPAPATLDLVVHRQQEQGLRGGRAVLP